MIGLVMGMGIFTYCSESDKPSSSEKADLVVYGKIFTAEDNELVEAFAVKDGKYVYVGDKDVNRVVNAFISGGKDEMRRTYALGTVQSCKAPYSTNSSG